MDKDVEVNAAIENNLSRYDNDLKQMLDHVQMISNLTGGKSGFFGIEFPILIKALEARTRKLKIKNC